MAPRLPVTASDLSDYPGAPYPIDVVASAAESVRSDAGWHIAPEVTETVVVDGSGWGKLLLLPTLRLTAVTAVRVRASDDTLEPLDGWRIAGSGMLYHPKGWPYGIAGVEVDMTHGYPSVPEDLYPVIAARCQRARVDATITQRSETVGARTSSEAYNINRLEIEAGSTGLERYKLPSRLA